MKSLHIYLSISVYLYMSINLRIESSAIMGKSSATITLEMGKYVDNVSVLN